MSLHRIARYAGRPVLMLPDAARELALRALAFDARALRHERLARAPGSFLSRLGIGKLMQPKAMEDEEGEGEPLIVNTPLGYAPSYAGESEMEGFGWSLVEGIACLDIEGALLDRGFVSISGAPFWGYDTIGQALKEAMAEPRVRGVFVRMNSPGGVVAGTLEALTADIRALRQTGNANGKPIFVFADCAASAAYWIAAQADRIFAPAVGMVGSIGAVIVHEDWSGALEKDGVTVTAVQFGAKKTDGAWFKPLSEGALADLQAEIDAIGERFVADVERGREFLSRRAQLATEAGCYLAQHSDAERSGLALGLVDEIAHEAAAFAALKDHVARGGVTTVSPSISALRRAPAPAHAAQIQTGDEAQTENETMRTNTSARLRAALDRKAMDDTEKLDAIRKILDEEDDAAAEGEDEETTAEDEEETVAEDEQEETTAEGEDEEVEAEDEEETAAEDEDEKVNAKTAKAILALPEARGRESLAQKLAFTSGMRVKTARELLAAAPKASRLAGAVHEPQLGPAGDRTAQRREAESDDAAAANFIRSCHAMATGKAPAKR